MTTTIEQKQRLMTALADYRRWVREGRKPHGYKDGEQTYYDGYHDGIFPVEGKTDEFEFSVQTYDSPEGDSWWFGTFHVLPGGVDVELLESKSERR